MTTWLNAARIRDAQRGAKNLCNLIEARLPSDLLASVLQQLHEALITASDPDMSLNFFERFFLEARSRLSLAALIQRDPTVVPVLIRIFSTSNYLGELLVRDNEAFDALRMSEGQPQLLEKLVADICSLLESVTDPLIAMRILRRFKHRETLRIAYGDLVVQHRMGMVTEQISWLAQALSQGALKFCDRLLQKKWGTPRDESGNIVPFVILAMGKLGGRELNYSSDIDLVMVFGANGECDGSRSRSCQDYFDALTRDFSKLMNENTADGFAWRVDLRLRPEGQKGRLSNSATSFLRYYEQKGRAWERQALIKARPVAGDIAFGEHLLVQLEPWIWRRLSHYDITAVRSLKRQIEHRAIVEGVDELDVKTGRGGIRDIEFTIQFLQLLHGRRLKKIRQFNTLRALEQLQIAGCLTMEEESLLIRNYVWLRKLEHRLQIMSDLQTHRLPDDPNELRRIALRMDFPDSRDDQPLRQFQAELARVTSVNRRILDHQLHGAFADETDGDVPECVDLIYVPEIKPALAERALAGYAFSDPLDAARRIQGLSNERTPFLSLSRCRHFLAAVLPKLLREISNSPSPDRTLATLQSVTDQLGGKGVLWEMFNAQPEAMRLFVRMCAYAGYLTGILYSQPGMIDELVDALLVGQLPTRKWLRKSLAELNEGASDPTLIIQSFKQAQHLRTGVVDLIGRSDIEKVNRTLSDIADVCLQAVATFHLHQLRQTMGDPLIVDSDGNSRPCNCAIIACGKLGGQELNYQSDLDLLFVYEGDGQTTHHDPAQQTTNQHFFSRWASDVTRFVTAQTAAGQLYDLDSRLRPTGKSGTLATSVPEMLRYFQTGQGQSWEQLAMCKARVIWSIGDPASADDAILQAITSRTWSSQVVDEIEAMRLRLERSATSADDIKRGKGGTVDIEFAVQLIQMRYVNEFPVLRNPSAPASLRLAMQNGLIGEEAGQTLLDGYRLLRSVESFLRLCEQTAQTSLSSSPDLPNRIAMLLTYSSGDRLLKNVDETRKKVRDTFVAVLQQLRQS